MDILRWLIYGVALFFAIGWTYALVRRPDFRLKSSLVTVPYWWVGIGLAFTEVMSPFHLLWFMPIALGLPSFVLTSSWRILHASTVIHFLISSLVLVPALYVAARYGTPA